MTTKTLFSVYVSTETDGAIRAKAEACGASLSALTELFLRLGMKRIPDDMLRNWAAKQPARRGPSLNGLTKTESAVTAAMVMLEARGEATRFSLVELAASAGLPPRTAYAGLKSLQRRGMVVGSESEALDRWGRPVESFWWRSTQAESASR